MALRVLRYPLKPLLPLMVCLPMSAFMVGWCFGTMWCV